MIKKTQNQITKDWPLSREPLVSIVCVTYNHEMYISDAIDGFLMQETNFPFEIIIGEDCSTDSTAKIVKKYTKKYPDIITSIIRPKNIGGSRNFNDCILKARGMYIAYCDGDDYWTDINKIKEQAKFLDVHPDYGLVHTNFNTIKNKEISAKKKINLTIYDQKNELLIRNFIGSLTVFFRRDSYIDAIKIYKDKYAVGDYPLWLAISQISKIGFIPKTTAMYRIHNNSCTHVPYNKKIKLIRSVYCMKNYFIKNHPYSKRSISAVHTQYCMYLLKYFILTNDKELLAELERYMNCNNVKNKFIYNIATSLLSINLIKTFFAKIIR